MIILYQDNEFYTPLPVKVKPKLKGCKLRFCISVNWAFSYWDIHTYSYDTIANPQDIDYLTRHIQDTLDRAYEYEFVNVDEIVKQELGCIHLKEKRKIYTEDFTLETNRPLLVKAIRINKEEIAFEIQECNVNSRAKLTTDYYDFSGSDEELEIITDLIKKDLDNFREHRNLTLCIGECITNGEKQYERDKRDTKINSVKRLLKESLEVLEND